MDDPPVMLISGTSRGIGKYLVKHYAHAGYQVIGCSRSPVDYENDQYQHHILDVSDESKVKEMFSDIRSRHRRLDVLINNAGVASQGLVMTTKAETIHDVFNTNFLGPFLLCREAVKLMKAKSFGRIVNLSSVHVPLGSMGTSVYGASKAAVEQFSQVLAGEVAPFGITVNTLGLSYVQDVGMAGELSDETVSDSLDRTILKSRIALEDVAHTMDFLVSPRSGMLTNQTIYLGGV